MRAHSHTHCLRRSVIVRLENPLHSRMQCIWHKRSQSIYTSTNVLLVLSLCCFYSTFCGPVNSKLFLTLPQHLSPAPFANSLDSFSVAATAYWMWISLPFRSICSAQIFPNKQPLPTAVEAIYLQRTNRTPNPRPSARAHAHIARVLLLCRVLGRG